VSNFSLCGGSCSWQSLGNTLNSALPIVRIDQKSLSERDICTQFITPALVEATWDLMIAARTTATLHQILAA